MFSVSDAERSVGGQTECRSTPVGGRVSLARALTWCAPHLQLLRNPHHDVLRRGRHEGRAHFHAAYGEDDAVFDIESLELIAGKLPRRARKLVVEWARAHQDELHENWHLARAHKSLHPIDPLP